jgi:hypothetical protein
VRQGLIWPEWSTSGADWVLDRAVWMPTSSPAAPPDPGAEHWLPAVAEHAEQAVTEMSAEARKWAFLVVIAAWALAGRK